MADITAALIGLKAIGDFIGGLRSTWKDAESLKRASEIEAQVGEVFGKLHELRGENLHLLEENRRLAEEVRAAEDWRERRGHYKLVKAPGGAHVLRHDGSDDSEAHYACPTCVEKRLLVPLQDNAVSSGAYSCPSCKFLYNVDRGTWG
jgi:hypothetical protein